MSRVPPGGPEPWRSEFPYRWSGEDRVGRRHFLTLAVLTSAAVFLGTVGLAIRGAFDDRRRGTARPIVNAAEVPEGEAYYFNYPTADDQAVLLHLPGGLFVAYNQECTHLACAVRFEAERGRLHCPCHEGVFDPRTGEPVAGPPRRPLPRIAIRREGDTLVAVEEVP